MKLPANNVQWMQRAFLFATGSLMTEITTPSGDSVTEDYVRGALVRGLILSNPKDAHRVDTETTAPWSDHLDFVHGTHKPGKGSKVRHDVGVAAEGKDAGLLCEVKWLKQAKGEALLMDVWKLAMSRSTGSEIHVPKTFLVIGGLTASLAKTREKLTAEGMYMPWSPKGRGGGAIQPRMLRLQKGVDKSDYVLGAWKKLVAWGQPPNYRTPPACWAEVRLVVRDRWWLTAAGRSWQLVLWEIDHRGSGITNDVINWTPVKAKL